MPRPLDTAVDRLEKLEHELPTLKDMVHELRGQVERRNRNRPDP